jgi:hypothetical protein
LRPKADRDMAATALDQLTTKQVKAPATSPWGALTRRFAAATASPKWWTVLVCVTLLSSAGLRQWRDTTFSEIAQEGANCPFPLSEFPRTLGSWTSNARDDDQLADEISRIAGSSDHFIRVYNDQSSGDVAGVLAIYGLANSVFAHTPDVCYRAIGFQQVMAAEERRIEVPGWPKPVRFRALYFVKKVGGVSEYTEVLYTFLHNGDWLSDVAPRWKMFRFHPGMFKLQVERRVTSLSLEASPSPDLLKRLIQVINTRVAQSKAGTEVAAKTQGR